MRIKIILENQENKDIILPIHYNELIQKTIYNNIPKILSHFIHEIGFKYNKRSFKLFTFSKIKSNKIKLSKNHIFFNKLIEIQISSPIDIIIKTLKENLEKKQNLRIYKNKLIVKEINTIEKPNFSEFTKITKIKTLSPITIYKTIIKNNKKYTQYLFPEDPEFNNLIKENIKKKYAIIKGITDPTEIPEISFHLTPIDTKIKILKYKNFIIKGIEGILEINTNNIKVLQEIYDAGLGAKNSQGFGMFEFLECSK